MQTLRCQCGKAIAWSSGWRFADCEGCDHCKTTYYKEPLQDHEWAPLYDENTGALKDQRCKKCRTRKSSEDEYEKERAKKRAEAEYQRREEQRELEDGTAAYKAVMDSAKDSRDYYAPHCDSLVLHAPGKCEYCDKHPDWQTWRIEHKVNFTGESDPDKAPCFAERKRPADVIHRWYGNRPDGV